MKQRLSVKLTKEEKGFYGNLFEMAAKPSSNRVEGKEGADFLKKSGLQKETLKNLWMIAAQTNLSFLERDEFYVVLRLIALTQNNLPADEKSIFYNEPIPPLPKFDLKNYDAKPVEEPIQQVNQGNLLAQSHDNPNINNLNAYMQNNHTNQHHGINYPDLNLNQPSQSHPINPLSQSHLNPSSFGLNIDFSLSEIEYTRYNGLFEKYKDSSNPKVINFDTAFKIFTSAKVNHEALDKAINLIVLQYQTEGFSKMEFILCIHLINKSKSDPEKLPNELPEKLKHYLNSWRINNNFNPFDATTHIPPPEKDKKPANNLDALLQSELMKHIPVTEPTTSVDFHYSQGMNNNNIMSNNSNSFVQPQQIIQNAQPQVQAQPVIQQNNYSQIQSQPQVQASNNLNNSFEPYGNNNQQNISFEYNAPQIQNEIKESISKNLNYENVKQLNNNQSDVTAKISADINSIINSELMKKKNEIFYLQEQVEQELAVLNRLQSALSTFKQESKELDEKIHLLKSEIASGKHKINKTLDDISASQMEIQNKKKEVKQLEDSRQMYLPSGLIQSQEVEPSIKSNNNYNNFNNFSNNFNQSNNNSQNQSFKYGGNNINNSSQNQNQNLNQQNLSSNTSFKNQVNLESSYNEKYIQNNLEKPVEKEKEKEYSPFESKKEDTAAKQHGSSHPLNKLKKSQVDSSGPHYNVNYNLANINNNEEKQKESIPTMLSHDEPTTTSNMNNFSQKNHSKSPSSLEESNNIPAKIEKNEPENKNNTQFSATNQFNDIAFEIPKTQPKVETKTTFSNFNFDDDPFSGAGQPTVPNPNNFADFKFDTQKKQSMNNFNDFNDNWDDF